jgi:hypothetical protein
VCKAGTGGLSRSAQAGVERLVVVSLINVCGGKRNFWGRLPILYSEVFQMAYNPPDAEWYIAEIVLEIKVENALASRVWINTHLVRADSPEEAYVKAQKIGRDSENSYVNIEDEQVECIFRGLAQLQVIFGKLKDGVEINWCQYDDLSAAEVEEWISPKEQLEVFLPVGPVTKSRYLPIEMLPQVQPNAQDNLPSSSQIAAENPLQTEALDSNRPR